MWFVIYLHLYISRPTMNASFLFSFFWFSLCRIVVKAKEISGYEKLPSTLYHATLAFILWKCHWFCCVWFSVSIEVKERQMLGWIVCRSSESLTKFCLFMQELPEPFRTMLEVMVKFIKDQGDLRSLSSSGTDRTNQKPNSSRYHILYNLILFERV